MLSAPPGAIGAGGPRLGAMPVPPPLSRLDRQTRPPIILVVVALVVAVWLVLTRVFTTTRAGRHAAHFLDVDGVDCRRAAVKYNHHPAPAAG